MLTSEYEKILKTGNRVEWYGTMVPEKLLTHHVKEICNTIQQQIDRYESEGVDDTSKKNYINNLLENIRLLPYKLNGDFYLIKKKEFENSETNSVKKRIRSK